MTIELDHQAENAELGLVLDATALRDELQELGGLIKTQLQVLQNFKTIMCDSEGNHLTGINLLERATEKMKAAQADFRDLYDDVKTVERDVCATYQRSHSVL